MHEFIGFLVIVCGQVLDVLEYKILWLMVLKYTQDLEKKVAIALVFEPLLPASFGKRLTGKACAKDVVLGDIGGFDGPDVAVGPDSKILLIYQGQRFFYFGSKNALVTEPAKADMKASNPCEQIYKLHFRVFWFCIELMMSSMVNSNLSFFSLHSQTIIGLQPIAKKAVCD